MQDIQELGDSIPLEALGKLQGIKIEVEEKGSEYVQKKYGLLYTRLKDKADILPTYTDTIESVFRYFEKNGSVQEKAEAHYYLASVYRDLQDYPMAVSHFLQAVELLESTDKFEVKLLCNAYSQLIYIYNNQSDHDAALQTALKEIALAKKHGFATATIYMDAATSYSHLEDSLHAREYCDKALDEYVKHKRARDYSVVAELCSRFAHWGDTAKATSCMQLLDEIPEQYRPYNYASARAAYAELFGTLEENIEAYEKLLEESVSPEAKMRASLSLLRLYTRKGDDEKRAYYVEQCMEYNNRSVLQERSEKIAKARGEAVYRKNMEAEQRAKEEAEHARTLAWGSLAGLVVLVAILATAYSLRIKRMMKEIIRKDAEIKTGREALEKREQILAGLNEEIRQKEETIRQRQIQMNDLMKMALMEKATEGDSEVVERFKRAGEGLYTVTKADWKALFKLIDQLYPTFAMAINTRLPRISESRVQTCYLIKTGLTNPQIINIQRLPRQTIWDRVKSIRSILGEFFTL